MEFDSILEKIEQSTNAAQKEKLEADLKREIKKLQRLRDQVKSWASSNEIKDKAPLLEQRQRIETKMETFKAVEKAMKTKAYSKEGLSAAAKLDPREQAKVDAGTFLSEMVDELEQQIETLEAESEALQASGKKGKNHSAKADKIAANDAIIERHKWQQAKLELIRRSLENGGVEPEQVTDIEESIKYYVSDNMNDDFIFDEDMYEDLNLDGDEDAFGMNLDGERGGSSQDAKSEMDDASHVDEPISKPPPPAKPRSVAENSIPTTTRRGPASLTRSPLPALATLHSPLPTISSAAANAVPMKPASVPTRPVGEGLKYASAAAAAAANDRNVGIAPLPPPPGLGPLPHMARSSAANSPAFATVQPVSHQAAASPALSLARTVHSTNGQAPAPQPTPKTEPAKLARTAAVKAAATPQAPPTPAPEPVEPAKPEPKPSEENDVASTSKSSEEPKTQPQESESVYHLPPGLQDALDSFEMVHRQPVPASSPASLHMLAMSHRTCPTGSELSSTARHYRPEMPIASTGNGFPLEPLDLLDDPRLYKSIDPDTLFFAFYYQQGTLHQHLAAKALKEQSWRFHKQYQTWFQRHEEPKEITDDYELGAYRFFDYESTWMNRRKTDFRFTYRYLEDEPDMGE
jgi:CCR4-NOT transcription complex subunit 3